MDSVVAILRLEQSETQTAAGLVQAQATAGRIRKLQGRILEALSGFERATSGAVISTAPIPVLEMAGPVSPDEEFPADFSDFDEAINTNDDEDN